MFGPLDVSGIRLANQDLQDADLLDVTGLRASSLRGARLTGARLPPHIDRFTLVDRTSEQAKLARTTLLSLLLATVFYLLAVARATDSELFLNAVSNKLPIIGVDVPIRTFYLFTPLILSVMFGYANLYVLRMYESYLGLPAVFPDGLSRYEKVDGWLFSGLVVQLERDTVDAEISLLKLQYGLCIALLHVTFPLLVLYVWWRYLFSHDLLQLGYLSALFGLVLAMSVWFWISRTRMIREALDMSTRRGRLSEPRSQGWLAIGVTGALCLVSVAAATDHPRAGWLPAADLVGSQWTIATPEWEGRYAAANSMQAAVRVLREIRPVQLAGTNLRRARARGLIAINADLAGADLSGADLSFSRLTGGNLRGAVLLDTRLSGADLSQVDLSGATMTGVLLKEDATLRGANLAGASIMKADLGGINLTRAHLSLARISSSRMEGAIAQGADFNSANLRDVALNGANLSGAKLRTANLTSVALAGANLSGADLSQTVFDKVVLSGTDLTGAVGLTVRQLRNACGDAQTKIDTGLRQHLANC